MTEREIRARLDARAQALVDPERAWDDAKTFAHHYLQERHRAEALRAEIDDLRRATAKANEDGS
jgi:hypothetical protein